ncbi:superinfection immunity protein [Acidithiobacillus montserratensis]|uniref:Superinfection immunity protein n=1 Tax=Acidithiobacillus montserratensis TaxID=2729135 RepID=A0ACD5HII4_9PROT|nr:superinfection immunity protein [Acidithiobacillus montserratensis]MBU2748639.1 superinfection immunity protein [Acidithiobacillus montserratensis]
MIHWLFNTPAGSVVCVLLAVIFGLLLYFLPTLVAIAGHHPHPYWMFSLNIALAWTILGWAVLLAWSLIQHDTVTFDDGESDGYSKY